MSLGSDSISGTLGIIQQIIPNYRARFFDILASRWDGDVQLFATPDDYDAQAALRHAKLTLGRDLRFLPRPFTVHWLQGVRRWLEAVDPKYLVVGSNPRFLSSRPAVRWMHQRNRVALAWGLGTMKVVPGTALGRGYFRTRFLAQFDGLIAYGERAKREYVESGIPAERVFVAPNSVAARPTWDCPRRASSESRPKVLFVGTLIPRKKVENLVEACSRLPAPLQPELIIVGDGSSKPALQELAARRYPTTSFLGEQHGDTLQASFRKADLFVIPGTGGLAIQEAMSQGLPVVVAEADGTQEDLVRSENGWHVQPDDVDALAATLATALSDTQRLRDMGRASYAIVACEINLENMADRYIEAVLRTARLGLRSR